MSLQTCIGIQQKHKVGCSWQTSLKNATESGWNVKTIQAMKIGGSKLCNVYTKVLQSWSQEIRKRNCNSGPFLKNTETAYTEECQIMHFYIGSLHIYMCYTILSKFEEGRGCVRRRSIHLMSITSQGTLWTTAD